MGEVVQTVRDTGVCRGDVVKTSIMKAKLILFAFGVSTLVAACGTSAPTNNGPTPVVSLTTSSTNATSAPSATTAPAGTASAGSEPAPSSNPGIVGIWQSSSCGKRKYARLIQFETGGAFQGRDLVSPCPPGTRCLWSGIVNIKGTFEVQTDKIKLANSQPAAGPAPAEPFPTAMDIDRGTSSPVEILADGTRCAYTRADAAAWEPPR